MYRKVNVYRGVQTGRWMYTMRYRFTFLFIPHGIHFRGPVWHPHVSTCIRVSMHPRMFAAFFFIESVWMWLLLQSFPRRLCPEHFLGIFAHSNIIYLCVLAVSGCVFLFRSRYVNNINQQMSFYVKRDECEEHLGLGSGLQWWYPVYPMVSSSIQWYPCVSTCIHGYHVYPCVSMHPRMSRRSRFFLLLWWIIVCNAFTSAVFSV